MKLALAQLNQTIGDFKNNSEKIKDYSFRARDLGADLVIFSEMAITGYPPRDLLEKNDFVDANISYMNRLMDDIRGIGVICGFVDRNLQQEGKLLYNTAVLFEDGHIIHRVCKQLLPTYDVFDEMRYFEPGNPSTTCLYKGYRIGLTICEDIWNDKDFFKRRFYRIDPVEQLMGDHPDILINISASPFQVGKREFKWEMLRAICKKYQIPLVYVNQTGGNDSLIFDGLSTVFDKTGKMIARAKDFEEDLVMVDIKTFQGDIHPISESYTESILKALITGTHDYVSKCGFSKVVIGLSGGIDSALTAYIAVKALGPENVMTVFMPSRYTSKENYEDTEKLAQNLNIQYIQIPIDEIFEAFLCHISPDGRMDNPGITEQNIQARIRGTILMGLSNKYGSLVLTTGNKSELAVGYCTLYGDMNGGLAVISDTPKTMVYDLARFINKDKEIIPQRIIDKAPSAELKPNQKDQDDLPPYEILDQILKEYIENLKSIDEIVQMGFDKAVVTDVVKRIHRNEYKRYQAAPGLRVTSKSFGFGRRYPVAQRYC